MSHTISIRLTKELAEWLERTAAESGMAQGKLIRDQLEIARARSRTRPYMRLAGTVRGPANLSQRKGFSRT